MFKNVRLPLITGIALWPFVFCKEANPDLIFLNHEKIHLRQQVELLIVFFYIIYLAEWLYHFIELGDFWAAYREISFEKEAYTHQHDLQYLQRRSLFSSFEYF